MATNLGTLTLNLLANTGSYTQGLSRAERETNQATGKMGKAFSGFKDEMHDALNSTQLGSMVDSVLSKFSGLEGGILTATAAAAGMAVGGIGLAVGGLTTLALETAKANAEIAVLANRANVNTTSLQIMSFAAQQLGITQDGLAQSLSDAQEKLGEFTASGGSGGAADFFEALKNNTKMSDDQIKAFAKTLQGKDGVEALQLMKNKLDDLGATSQEQRFVFESLGGGMGDLLPLFAQGGVLLGEYGDALTDAGVIKSKEAIQQSQILAAQAQAVNLQFQGAKSELVTGFTPALVDVADAMFGTSKNGQQLQQVGRGVGDVFKIVAHAAIATTAGIQILANGLAGMAAIGATIFDKMNLIDFTNPLGFVKAAYSARKEIAALSDDIDATSSKIALDAGARLERLWDPATASTNQLVQAQVNLVNSAHDANTGLQTNTAEAKENAKAKADAAKQTAKAVKAQEDLNKVMGASEIKGLGLRLKSSESISGGGVKAYTAQFAKMVQDALGSDLTRFTSLNDSYHKGKGGKHPLGQAFDFTVSDAAKANESIQRIKKLAADYGFTIKTLNEYSGPSKNATGGHIHVSVLGFKGTSQTLKDAQALVGIASDTQEKIGKAQQSIAAKYMTEWEKLELEHAASVQEIKEAYAENDPSRKKYLDLQQAVYAQDLKQFTDNERLKREEAWRALDEIQGSLMESRVNSLAAASMTPDQLNAWQRTNIQQDGFSQLGDDFNNGVGAINGNEFLSEQERNSQLLALHDSFLLAKSALTQEYAQQDIEFAQAQQDLMLAQYSGIFSSTTDMMKNAFGEQSKAYAIAFAIQKGFAVGQAALSLAMNVAKASEIGFPYNLPMIAGAFAQGAQIVSIISGAQVPTGMAHDGIDYVPKEGTWLLDKGERVLSPRQNADFTRSLAERREVQQKPTSVENNMKVVILDDRSGVDQEMMGPSGEKAFLYHWKRNQSRLSR